MEASWKSGLTIDRINSDGNYSKANCRWSTRKEQNRNRRDRKLTLRDVWHIRRLHAGWKVQQWRLAKMYGITQQSVQAITSRKVWM